MQFSETDPVISMNRRRLLDLFWEFAYKLEAVHTFYLDSIVGYSVIYERVLQKQENLRTLLGANHELANTEFQDTCSTVYKQLGGKDYSAVSMSPIMKQGNVKNRVKEDGQNTLLLGSQCLVALYSYWEEHLRVEIGKAIGVLPQNAERNDATRHVLNKYVANDMWADIRHIRNSIVHNNGIANSEIVKCKVITWFKPMQPIELDHGKMRQIFLSLGRFRNELHTMSLPPRKPIRLP